MPLPELAPSNTERWFYRYSVGNDVHTLMVRTKDNAQASAVVASINSLMLAAAPFMFLASTVDLQRSLKGSDVRLPQDGTGLAGSYGTNVPSGHDSVFALTFPGRGQTGRKARVMFLGVKLFGDNNYRYTPAENTAVAAVINELNAGDENIYLAIDGTNANWYQYATSKQNDHYVGKRRGE